MRKVLIFAALLLIFPLNLFGQLTELSRDRFFELVRKASTATETVPYRSTTTRRSVVETVFKVDQIQINEALPNGNRRLIQKEGGEIIEVITVNKKNYQRENGGKWRQVMIPENVTFGRTVSGPYTSEFSTAVDNHNGQKVTIFSWLIKLDSGQFSESKTFVGTNGRILREESSGGTLGKQKETTWDEAVVYDYSFRPLTIRAPIK